MNKLIAIGLVLPVTAWMVLSLSYGNPATVLGVSVLLGTLVYEVLEEVTA